jgi:hypothetical protein
MPEQMRYEQSYPVRFDGPRPPMATHWPAPPGGWFADGPDDGASTKSPMSADPSPAVEPPGSEEPAVAAPPGFEEPPASETPAASPGMPPIAPTSWPHPAPPPPSGRPKHLALILSIVAGVVMIGIVGAATATAFLVHRAYQHAQAQPTVGMDTPVRDGDFQFTADSVRCGIRQIGTPDDYQLPVGQFCVVTLSIMNVGKEPAIFADAIQRARGSGGVSFISDSEAGFYANQDPGVFLNDINPGNKVQVLIVYDIPPTGRIQALEVHENPTTKGAIIKVS